MDNGSRQEHVGKQGDGNVQKEQSEQKCECKQGDRIVESDDSEQEYESKQDGGNVQKKYSEQECECKQGDGSVDW